MSRNKFNMKDKVYHITPEGPQGTVLDIQYSFRYDEYLYNVVWDRNDSDWYREDELSYNKVL